MDGTDFIALAGKLAAAPAADEATPSRLYWLTGEPERGRIHDWHIFPPAKATCACSFLISSRQLPTAKFG